MTTKILLYEDGPIEISNEKSMVTLCRCGQSANKPLCDGAHLGCDFEAVEATVKLDEHISLEVGESNNKGELLKKYTTLMEAEVAEGDFERAHGIADDLLCQLLTELGYEKVVNAFNRVNKWYA